MTSFRAVLVVTLLVLAPAYATGAEPVSDMARAHYKAGKAHYQLGEFREALPEFKEAYRLVQDPAFLFNVAQCHRQLGQYQDAIKVYNAYLRDAPGAANRPEVEKLIREVTAALERERTAPPTPQATAAPVATTPPATATPPSAAPPPLTTADGTTKPATDVAPAAAGGAPAAPTPAPTSGTVAAPASTPSGAGGAAAAASAPAAATPPTATAPRPTAMEGELEVLSNEPQAIIAINHNTVGRKDIKLKLPPGLYSVSVEAEGFQGIEGAVALMAGDRTSVSARLLPVKSHGWRKLGYVLTGLAVVGEGAGIVGHVQANRFFVGSKDFENMSRVEKIGQGVAIGSAVLATTCYLLDWLTNRGRVEPGSHGLLEPTERSKP